jgi:hypothetical protein
MKSLLVGLLIGAALGLGASAAARSPQTAKNGCVPCGPDKPCQNPLTVCSNQNPGGNGCCLGLAGG